ncbi:hypothetical protein [Cryobacterium sp. Y11]|uniref:hypothetical protein n=1 Tax=Cryobacterium sp. Y11 TaxID=2045016 RepID=UPI000CE4BC82|nr:hypothetical protein [Cryobacterium sp. Y11]
MNARRILGRPLLWIVTAGAGAILMVALASVLANSLAIAEQPGRPIGVPAVSVQPGGAATPSATPFAPTLGPTIEPTAEPTADPTTDPTPAISTPELVPAADPVVVDDHGGDNPGHDDDTGDDSGGSGSSSGGSGSSRN